MKKDKNKNDNDLKSMIDRMNYLHIISQKISEKKPLPLLLNEIMESCKLIMNAEASSLLLYESATKKLNFLVAIGNQGKLIKQYSVDIGTGIAGWVAENRKPLLIEDCYNDPRFNPKYDQLTEFMTKSMICVPLIRKNNLLGIIQVINRKDGKNFDKEDFMVFEILASQCAIAIENARLIEIQVENEAFERELETARKIQMKLLPDKLPEYSDIQVVAKLTPAKMVGGDYYNIIKINDNESFFIIADVSGKGIPAALIVSTINSCLQTYLSLNPVFFDINIFVNNLNEVLIKATTVDKFVTCWFGLYNHTNKNLKSINASHNPPFIFRKDLSEPVELKKGGLVQGVMKNNYEVEEVNLKTDDLLILYTDGITEAMDSQKIQYGEDRFISLIKNNINLSAMNLMKVIEMDIHSHVKNAKQSDDLTYIVIKIL